MKLFNRIIIVLEIVCAIGILWCIIKFFFLAPGSGPDEILSAVDLKLPDYKIENTSDNLDRGASRFDNFTYEITFSPQEETLLKQLQGRGWQKQYNLYTKTIEVDEDLTYSAFVNPQIGSATLDVMIDEDYSQYYIMYAILILVSALVIAGVWGIVKLYKKFT